MKLVQFHLPETGCRIGVLDGDEVLDITSSEIRSTMDLIEKATSEGVTMDEVASYRCVGNDRALPFPYVALSQ